jgi:hypothetical protein
MPARSVARAYEFPIHVSAAAGCLGLTAARTAAGLLSGLVHGDVRWTAGEDLDDCAARFKYVGELRKHETMV